MVITARGLGPEGRGVLSAALLLTSLAAGISQLGLGTAFVYASRIDPLFPGRVHYVISVIGITLLAMSLAGLALYADTTLQPQIFFPLLLLAGATTVNMFSSTVMQLAPGLSAYNAGRIGLSAISLLALLVLVGLEELTVTNILWTQLAATIAVALFLSVVAWKLIDLRERISDFTQRVTSTGYLLSGLKYHGTALLGLLLLNIDKITIYALGNAVEFGLYTVAYGTSRLLGGVQEAMSTALYARFAGKDPRRLAEVVQLSFRLSFLPLLIVALLLGGMSPWILPLMYGDAFSPVALPFAILLVECVVGNSSWVLAQQFNATGRPGIVLVRQLVAVGPVLLLIFFIPSNHVALSLSLILLLSALIRLIVTMLMFKWVSKLPLPTIFPSMADIRLVWQYWRRLRNP